MCSGGNSGGSNNPLSGVGNVIEEAYEYVAEGDLGDDLQEGLEGIDHNMTQVKEGIIDPVGEAALATLTEGPVEAYQGSDIDVTLETTQAMGELAYDIIHTAVSGEDQGKVKEIKEAGSAIQDAYGEAADSWDEAGDNLSDIGEAVGDAWDTTMQVAEDYSDKMAEYLGVTREEQRRGADVTRGGDVERDDLMFTLGKKKSDLKAAKKKGKKGLRIDYGVSLPGMGKSGIAA